MKKEYLPQEKTKMQPPKRHFRPGFVLLIAVVFSCLLIAAAVFLSRQGLLPALPTPFSPSESKNDEETLSLPEYVQVDLIEIDGESRRGVELEAVRNIVVHYVGNPGTTAQQNRNWFNNPESDTSSHFVIGLEGEVILCVPLSEKSSASNYRNGDTISIEVCHPDESGVFTEASYNRLVELCAWLCQQYRLTPDCLIRHYDVTGKLCPLYFVEHEDAWNTFVSDVRTLWKKNTRG